MKPKLHKPAKEEQPRRKGKLSGSKRRMIANTREWKPNTSPKLREIYSTRIEWLQKPMPKLAKEAE